MRKIFALLMMVGMAVGLNAQKTNDPVIFEINGKNIYKSEFMREFLRSVGKDPSAAPTACTYEKRQALEEYVELFVNYRTKLEDAYNQGFDTMPDMVKELKGYRNELAAPYLIDSVTLEKILREAYDRNHYTLHAAHILVRLKKQPTPADTLKAYNKAMEYYNRVKNGEDFFAVATEAAQILMDEESVPLNDNRRKDNGDLGNFNVFEMVYPFESAAYSLEVGEVSLPVRTSFGYHVIKLLDKSPYLSRASFQHIWGASNTVSSQTEGRIRQAYEKIKAGESFETVCNNYSDDQSTAEQGGLLKDMMVREIPPEYVSKLSRMKPGEVSEPFETRYGWHIVKLNKRDSLPSYDEMLPYYKQRLSRDVRSLQPRLSFVEQCKNRYNFKDYTKLYVKSQAKTKGKKAKTSKVPMASLDECRAALSDSVFIKAWHYSDTMVKDMRPLFSVEEMEYTAKDLLKYIEKKQKSEMNCDLDMYLQDRYNNYINDKVFEYADKHLEDEHNEFAQLMDEYRNGLMIFSYNDQMIWSKAIKDTTGLAAFYDSYSKTRNIDDENDAPYFWNERAQLVVLTVDDSSYLTPKKAVKLMEKGVKKGWTVEQMRDKINSAIKGESTFRLKKQMVENGHQNILTQSQWRKGIYERPLPKGYEVVEVEEVMNPTLKSLKEARGYYINEYHTYLEQQLIKQLRKKYNVVIHQDVIDEITY
ncbi:MAG: peptidylprolyl isomerase [Bacteroidales bacterium]|nr:peptidylprolyl isomerase [Bacteroidales bacterium]